MNDPKIFEISLKVILKNSQGEALLMKIGPTSEIAGSYDFPGGRINNENNDNLIEVIEREMKEELGSKIKYNLNREPVSYGFHFYHSKITKEKVDVLWILFDAEYLGGEIATSEEHSEYIWKRLNKDNIEGLFKRGAYECAKHYLEFKND